MNQHDYGWAYAFIATTTAIAAGYVSVPFLVLAYLPIGRWTLLFGSAMFGAAALTAMWVMTVHPWASPTWVAIHAGSAVCTWAFILAFWRRLARTRPRHARTS